MRSAFSFKIFVGMSCSSVALAGSKFLILFNIFSLTTGIKLKQESGNACLIAVTLVTCVMLVFLCNSINLIHTIFQRKDAFLVKEL